MMRTVTWEVSGIIFIAIARMHAQGRRSGSLVECDNERPTMVDADVRGRRLNHVKAPHDDREGYCIGVPLQAVVA